MTIKESVEVRRYGDGWRVWLVIGVQSFPLSLRPESKEHAEWYADMLRFALNNLYENI